MKRKSIEITDEDRALYSPEIIKKEQQPKHSLSVIKGTDKFKELSIPIKIPRVPTISDLRLEGNLSNTALATIQELSDVFPKINFDNLTQEEAEEVKSYNEKVANMSRKEIWDIIKPYFNSVFNIRLGDISSKMTEIARRLENDHNYLPTMECIKIICQTITKARGDLFVYNIDLKTRRFDTRENPIEFLLMMIKVQKEMYPKRNKKVSNTFISKFNELIRNHSELMIKLKIDGRTGEDFFGHKYNEIKESLKTLKNISYTTFGGKPFSQMQQTEVVNIIDEYKSALDLIFEFDESESLFFEKELFRPKKNIELASLEVYHTFNDSATYKTNKYRIKEGKTASRVGSSMCCEIINSIFLEPIKGKSTSYVFNTGISLIHLKDFLSEYFEIDNELDRTIIKEKLIKGSNETNRIIKEMFFTIINKYI